MDRGVHTLPDKSVFLHSSCTELVPVAKAESHGTDWTTQYGKPFWVRSCDDGNTWSVPKRFPPLPDAVWGHPAQHSGVSRSGLLALPDGRLLLPSKATDLTTGEFRYFGMMRVSRDMGQTWEYGGRIAEDPVAHFTSQLSTELQRGVSSCFFVAIQVNWVPLFSDGRDSIAHGRRRLSSLIVF